MTQLKVVTWNIWGGKHLPEVIACLREINADIIGLQEVLQDEDGQNNCAQAIAEALGYNYVYETTIVLTPEGSYLLQEHGIQEKKGWGNAILSKYEIASHSVHFLSEERKRTALEAIIKVGDNDLHVFSVHLAFTSSPGTNIQSIQTNSLLPLVPKERAIVMGDFNATPDSEAIQRISNVMKSAGGTPADRTPIDYIFLTKDIAPISAGVVASEASDHLPVYSIVEV